MRPLIDALAVAVLIGGLAVALSGCGGTPAQQHSRLNTLTAVADPSYELAVEACDEARDAILARTGTTYEQDRRAMDQINAVCDSIVEGFETLRGSQRTARQAIDSGAEGAAATAIAEALALWPRLQALAEDIEDLGTEGE